MSILAGDLEIQLAFSIHENKGVFALLLGSGLSRAAQIPTGWEITLDLVRRVAKAQGVSDQSDWAAWYRERTGNDPDYSALLEEIAVSREERRSILHTYIEPTEEDRQERRKIPTSAHHAIAGLVRSGHIRVIITTNFDRLMENALREAGVEPTVVASVDALAGAEPIIHSTCYILKLHGDYKDVRILNTESELRTYRDEYKILLDRIFDEHGLVVCGWSGEWDHALREALQRVPNRRYPVFWAARGEPKAGATDLIEHRRARVIPIADADGFFVTLRQRVDALEQTHRQNPRNVDLLVGMTKRFLARPEHRIQLDDLFTQEANRVLEQLDDPVFSADWQWEKEEFRRRVSKYEAISEPLASISGVLGRWGDESNYSNVVDVIGSIYSQYQDVRDNLFAKQGLRYYPAVLIFAAYGLGLTRSQRWRELHNLFDASIDQRRGQRQRIVDRLFLQNWEGAYALAWQDIEGLERRKTPLSDHLFELFSQWGKCYFGFSSDFDLLFSRFELLGSLASFEPYLTSEERDPRTLALRPDQLVLLPFGRIGRDEKYREKLISELNSEPTKSSLIDAGFSGVQKENIQFFMKALELVTR